MAAMVSWFHACCCVNDESTSAVVVSETPPAQEASAAAPAAELGTVAPAAEGVVEKASGVDVRGSSPQLRLVPDAVHGNSGGSGESPLKRPSSLNNRQLISQSPTWGAAGAQDLSKASQWAEAADALSTVSRDTSETEDQSSSSVKDWTDPSIFSLSGSQIMILTRGRSADFRTSLLHTLPMVESHVEMNLVTEEELEQAMVASSLASWKHQDYTMLSPLGRAPGNFGMVSLSVRKSDDTKLAVKEMLKIWVKDGPSSFTNVFPESYERPWVEIGILRCLNKRKYPYACELHGIFQDKDHVFVATSFATEGNMFGWCITANLEIGPEREKAILPLASQLCSALRMLHDLGIAHRSVSLSNILLSKNTGNTSLKLIGFGTASLGRLSETPVCGQHIYWAPEVSVVEGAHDAFLADNFAVGVVLFVLAGRAYPWKSTVERDACPQWNCCKTGGAVAVLKALNTGWKEGQNVLEVMSPGLVEILNGLLQPDVQKRLCLGEECYKTSNLRSVWDKEWMKSVHLPAG